MSKVLARQFFTDEEARLKGIAQLPAITWSESLTISGVFVALLLGLACWRFSVKDY